MAKEAKPRSRYHHGDLRSALIDAAVDAIAKLGVEGLSLKPLATQLGVTHTAPYRHFPDKRALIDEVIRLGFDKLTQRMERAHDAAHEDERARFLATGLSVVEFAVKHPGYYRAMFFGHSGNTLRDLASAPPDSAFRRMLGYIEDWQRAGLLRASPPIELALAIWATTHGFACLCMSGQLRARNRRELRALADAAHMSLLDGVGR